MAPRKPRAKWTLPNVVNPTARKSFCVPVPNDPYHLAAFRGALLDLASAYKWADDPAHTAKDVAIVWRDILENLEECGGDCVVSAAEEGMLDGMIRQNPANCAQLQSSVDGINWCEFADFSSCIADQTIQPGATPQLPPGGQYSNCLSLSARDRWLLPIPVSTGDVISLTSIAGAWNDGTANWNCPDGSPFVLGACIGTKSHAVGDPSATFFHMQLLLNINGTWYDPVASPVTVPAGVVNVQAWFQANDATLNDNQGTIGFCVGLVKGAIPANSWQHIFDFTTGQHGWAVNGSSGVYIAGQGYGTADAAISGGYERSVYIRLISPNMLPATYTYVEFDFVATFGTFAYGGAAASPEIIDMPNGTRRQTVTPAAGQTQVATPALSVANPADIYCKVFADKQTTLAALAGQCIINRVILRGTGTSVDPYAAY